MKHLLTTLLVLLTFTLHAQQETALVGQSMNRIVEVEGEYDDYGVENEDPYIKYYEDGFAGTTVYFFNNYGICDRAYLIVEKRMELDLKRVLNDRYARMEMDVWHDVQNQAYLRLLEMDNKLVVRITKRR